MRSLLLLALVAASAVAQDLDTNRVIKSYVDRYNAQRAQVLGRSNPELLGCKDPECHQDMYMIVTTKGYPCEQHIATTADNVNLTIFRIPHGRHNKNVTGKRPVVFLQHGLLASSADWIINFPEQSFGFLLADAGFDVWMGNVRGNTYGVSSLPAKPTEAQREKFWDFSFDEMAKYDLPAMVEKSLKVSGASQLAAYIGHSQGTLIGFIHFSQQPEWAKQKIGRFYALAPIAYMPHTTSPLRYIAKFSESKTFVHFLLWLMGGVEFLPRSQLVDDMCSLAPETICGNLLNVIAGYDAQNMNNSRLPVYSSKSPAGTSSQNLIHFGQLIQTGSLRAYDYMSDRNMQKYGQKKPPVYYVNQMTLPTALYWGEHGHPRRPDRRGRRLEGRQQQALLQGDPVHGPPRLRLGPQRRRHRLPAHHLPAEGSPRHGRGRRRRRGACRPVQVRPMIGWIPPTTELHTFLRILFAFLCQSTRQ